MKAGCPCMRLHLSSCSNNITCAHTHTHTHTNTGFPCPDVLQREVQLLARLREQEVRWHSLATAKADVERARDELELQLQQVGAHECECACMGGCAWVECA
eukprot:1160436-Pelagomonas_calceolata.AAC.9